MSSINVFIFSLIISVSVFSQAQLYKVVDGKQAYCNEPQGSPYLNSDKIIKMEIQNGQLVIQAVNCNNHDWVLDKSILGRNYTGFNGVKVFEKYFDFRLLAVSPDAKKHKIISLSHFQNSSEAKVSLDMIKSVSSVYIDLIIQSARYTETNKGYKMTDDVEWGVIRLRLNN